MRQLAIVLTPCLVLLGLACAPDPEEPNAFMTQGYTTYQTSAETTSADSTAPQDMPSGDGDGSPGDGDGSPTTSTTSSTTNPTTTSTTTTGDGDGDTTTGGAVCGNGVIDNGEQCDGGNLGGFTCIDLGYSGGTLGCDPVTCTYDASACVNNSSTTGGTSG